jgi:hypothetical protein
MQYGYDPKIQWIRKTSKVDKNKRYMGAENFLLHFCGKTFRCISPYTVYSPQEVLWDNDSYEKFCTQNKIIPRLTRFGNRFWLPENKSNVLGYIQDSDVLNDKYKTPIILETANELILNPSLRDIQFYKVYDPVTTYQQLSLYFGNKFFNEPVMASISDSDRINQHGFDKHSFRKAAKEK